MVGRRTPTIVARDNARGSAQEEDGRASERGPADISTPGAGRAAGIDRGDGSMDCKVHT